MPHRPHKEQCRKAIPALVAIGHSVQLGAQQATLANRCHHIVVVQQLTARAHQPEQQNLYIYPSVFSFTGANITLELKTQNTLSILYKKHYLCICYAEGNNHKKRVKLATHHWRWSFPCAYTLLCWECLHCFKWHRAHTKKGRLRDTSCRSRSAIGQKFRRF